MPMKRILLIDDDAINARIITHYLSAEYETVWADSACSALSRLDEGIDLILLDILLPDTDGITLCRQIRERIYCPILFISCLDEEETVIRALRSGGDDYLTKPFSAGVLLAKLEAHFRRLDYARKVEQTTGTICLDPQSHDVLVSGRRCHLSTIAYDILRFFLAHPRHAYTAEELYLAVWNAPSYGDVRTVISHIYALRQQLEDDPHTPRYLRSIRGYGYYFDPEGNEPILQS